MRSKTMLILSSTLLVLMMLGRAPLHALLEFAAVVYVPAQTQAMLTLLVKPGASLEELDHLGPTPLRQEIAHRHRELAAMLLAIGADRSDLDATEPTALQATLAAPLREPDKTKDRCFAVDGTSVAAATDL